MERSPEERCESFVATWDGRRRSLSGFVVGRWTSSPLASRDFLDFLLTPSPRREKDDARNWDRIRSVEEDDSDGEPVGEEG